MNLRPFRVLGLLLAAGGAAVAVVAGDELTTVVAAILVASLGTLVFVVTSVAPSVRFPPAPDPVYEGDRLVALRAAFREGLLGRQKIVQAIAALDRAAHGPNAPLGRDPVLLHPESVDAPTFRAWVAARLDELEAAT